MSQVIHIASAYISPVSVVPTEQDSKAMQVSFQQKSRGLNWGPVGWKVK